MYYTAMGQTVPPPYAHGNALYPPPPPLGPRTLATVEGFFRGAGLGPRKSRDWIGRSRWPSWSARGWRGPAQSSRLEDSRLRWRARTGCNRAQLFATRLALYGGRSSRWSGEPGVGSRVCVRWTQAAVLRYGWTFPGRRLGIVWPGGSLISGHRPAPEYCQIESSDRCRRLSARRSPNGLADAWTVSFEPILTPLLVLLDLPRPRSGVGMLDPPGGGVQRLDGRESGCWLRESRPAVAPGRGGI